MAQARTMAIDHVARRECRAMCLDTANQADAARLQEASERRRRQRLLAAEHARAASMQDPADRKERWYVIQVPSGKEVPLCELIMRAAGNSLVSECFCPSFATQKKIKGEWKNVTQTLFPGYVIAVTGNVDELKHRLNCVSEFTRLLKMGEGFVPLSFAEQSWLSEYTSKGDREIPMSMGVMEGDKVRVISGPLKGREALIISINRRKCLAFIKMDMFGREIETKVGLGVLKGDRVSE